MNLHPAAAAAIALSGNFILSLGMVLQKRNVSWIGFKGEKDSGYRRRRAGWVLGFTLMNIVPVFYYVALYGLPANVVGATAGANVVFTAVLASLVLGERLGRRRALLSLLMFAAMAIAAFRGGAAPGGTAQPVALTAFLSAPLAAAALCLLARRRRLACGAQPDAKLAVAIAAAAGSLGGYMVLPMRALQAQAEGTALGWLASPFLYFYAAAGIGAFSLVQIAYKDGEMSSVSPAYYGMQVLWPAFASYFVMGSPFDPPQAAAFVAIAVCVALVARGRGEDVACREE